MKHSRTISLTLLVLLAAWQYATLVHLHTVAHRICCHGQVVKADGHGAAHHSDKSKQSDDAHHHHGKTCAFLDQLTAARSLPSVDTQPVIEIEAAAHAIPVDPIDCETSDRYRFRLSPAHSPPLA